MVRRIPRDCAGYYTCAQLTRSSDPSAVPGLDRLPRPTGREGVLLTRRHQQIAEELRRAITDGRLPGGQRTALRDRTRRRPRRLARHGPPGRGRAARRGPDRLPPGRPAHGAEHRAQPELHRAAQLRPVGARGRPRRRPAAQVLASTPRHADEEAVRCSKWRTGAAVLRVLRLRDPGRRAGAAGAHGLRGLDRRRPSRRCRADCESVTQRCSLDSAAWSSPTASTTSTRSRRAPRTPGVAGAPGQPAAARTPHHDHRARAARSRPPTTATAPARWSSPSATPPRPTRWPAPRPSDPGTPPRPCASPPTPQRANALTPSPANCEPADARDPPARPPARSPPPCCATWTAPSSTPSTSGWTRSPASCGNRAWRPTDEALAAFAGAPVDAAAERLVHDVRGAAAGHPDGCPAGRGLHRPGRGRRHRPAGCAAAAGPGAGAGHPGRPGHRAPSGMSPIWCCARSARTASRCRSPRARRRAASRTRTPIWPPRRSRASIPRTAWPSRTPPRAPRRRWPRAAGCWRYRRVPGIGPGPRTAVVASLEDVDLADFPFPRPA